ncbi:trypsin-like peptidase domain-containing protein [Streptomyces sp. R41]|uniref:Trypsin-like peptidase domain-containing protein n=1 Tax=Streptomyces sp. R41 TaxID=3238632 RepID=A0AB39RM32_9ACTN
MHGRVLVGARDRGGGCAVTARAVLTARHVVRGHDTAELAFALPTGRTVEVVRTEDDEQLDVAVLHLAEDVEPSSLSTATEGAVWRVRAAPHTPRGNDPGLTGIVDFAATEITNDRGYGLHVLQLRVQQDLGSFKGYSGSAVVIPGSGGVAGILVEQVPLRTRTTVGQERPASNVLYAVPVDTVVARFRLTGTVRVSARLPLETPIGNLVEATLGSADEPVPFGGRSAELAELTDWLWDASADRRLLVTATAGRGKSSLLIRWIDSLVGSPALSVVFVPISIAFDIATEDVVHRALVARVARAYRVPVAVSGRGADELREELADLLRRPPPSGRLLVVVDGLDEAVGWDPGPHFLPHELAEDVRVVLSARHTADRPTAHDWRERLGWRRARTLDVPALSVEGVREVLAHQPDLRAALPDLSGLAAELHRLSDGEPVVLRLYVDELAELLQEKGQVPDLSSLRSVERGLTAYFERWWADQEVQWRSGLGPPSSDVGALLDTLALACGPLTRGDALQVMRHLSPPQNRRTPMGDRLDRSLVALRRFLTRREGDRALVLGHPRYASTRQRRLREDGEFARVEDAYLTWAQETFRDVRKGRLAADDIPAYLVKHLGQHLDRAGAVRPELLVPLGSTEWRRAWDSTSEDVHGHLPDVRRAMSGLTAEARRGTVRRRRAFPVAAALGVAASRANTSVQAACLSPALAAELVRWNVWSESRAIGYVLGLQSPVERATGVGVLIPVLRTTGRAEIDGLLDSARPAHDLEFAEALAAYVVHLARISSPDEAVRVAEHQIVPDTGTIYAGSRRTYEEAYALISLVPHLDGDLAARACRKAVERLDRLGSGEELLRVLTASVPLDRAVRLAAALGHQDPEHAVVHWMTRGKALSPDQYENVARFPDVVAITAPWLPDSIRAERLSGALDDVIRDFDPVLWPDVLGRMAPHLTPDLCRRAQHMASSLSAPDRCRVYAALSRGPFPAHERQQIVEFLDGHAETALFGGSNHFRDAMAAMTQGGLGRLVLRIIRARDRQGDALSVLEAVAPALEEELIPEALRLAMADSSAGDSSGLRAVVARWASFGPSAASDALAETYRTRLSVTDDDALALSLTPEPPDGGWDSALRELAGEELRFAVLAGMCARLPMTPTGAMRLAKTLPPSWLRDKARRVAGTALAHGIDEVALSRLIDDCAGEDLDLDKERLTHAYFVRLARSVTPAAAVAFAQRGGSHSLLACALSAAGPDLPSSAVSLTMAAARRRAHAAEYRDRTKEGAWSAANLLVALLPSVSAPEADRLWEEVETYLDGQQAEMPWNLSRATQLFHHVPDRFRARAWSLLLPPGFAEGETSFSQGSRPGDVPVGWASRVAELIDAFDRHHLDVLAGTVERQAGSSGERDSLRAAIAVRKAHLGDIPEALDGIHDCGWAPSSAHAAMEIADGMAPEFLGEWINAVLRRFSGTRSNELRAAVLASSSPLQVSVPVPVAAEIAGRWLTDGRWRRRSELVADVIGLAPLLLRLDETGENLRAAVRGDASLKALRKLLA